MKVMVCRWCGDRLEPVSDEPGVYTHEKDGYSICWEAPNDPDGMGRNAEPIEITSM